MEQYNKEYLKEYHHILKEKKPLSKNQVGIYLLIHFIFLLVIPIILIEEFIQDLMINIIVFLTYMFFSNHISFLYRNI